MAMSLSTYFRKGRKLFDNIAQNFVTFYVKHPSNVIGIYCTAAELYGATFARLADENNAAVKWKLTAVDTFPLEIFDENNQITEKSLETAAHKTAKIIAKNRTNSIRIVICLNNTQFVTGETIIPITKMPEIADAGYWYMIKAGHFNEPIKTITIPMPQPKKYWLAAAAEKSLLKG